MSTYSNPQLPINQNDSVVTTNNAPSQGVDLTPLNDVKVLRQSATNETCVTTAPSDSNTGSQTSSPFFSATDGLTNSSPDTSVSSSVNSSDSYVQGIKRNYMPPIDTCKYTVGLARLNPLEAPYFDSYLTIPLSIANTSIPKADKGAFLSTKDGTYCKIPDVPSTVCNPICAQDDRTTNSLDKWVFPNDNVVGYPTVVGTCTNFYEIAFKDCYMCDKNLTTTYDPGDNWQKPGWSAGEVGWYSIGCDAYKPCVYSTSALGVGAVAGCSVSGPFATQEGCEMAKKIPGPCGSALDSGFYMVKQAGERDFSRVPHPRSPEYSNWLLSSETIPHNITSIDPFVIVVIDGWVYDIINSYEIRYGLCWYPVLSKKDCNSRSDSNTSLFQIMWERTVGKLYRGTSMIATLEEFKKAYYILAKLLGREYGYEEITTAVIDDINDEYCASASANTCQSDVYRGITTQLCGQVISSCEGSYGTYEQCMEAQNCF